MPEYKHIDNQDYSGYHNNTHITISHCWFRNGFDFLCHCFFDPVDWRYLSCSAQQQTGSNMPEYEFRLNDSYQRSCRFIWWNKITKQEHKRIQTMIRAEWIPVPFDIHLHLSVPLLPSQSLFWATSKQSSIWLCQWSLVIKNVILIKMEVTLFKLWQGAMAVRIHNRCRCLAFE